MASLAEPGPSSPPSPLEASCVRGPALPRVFPSFQPLHSEFVGAFHCLLLVVGCENATKCYYNQPPTTCNPLNTNLHFPIQNASRKTIGSFFGVVDARAGLYVKLPAVQRTIDVAVLGDAFAERATAMRTAAVQRVELPADVKQRQLTAAHMYTQSAVLRNFIRFGNGDE